MTKKALVRTYNGIVENLIEHEDGSAWPVPTGCHLVPASKGDGADIGATWDGTAFTRPEPATEPTSLPEEYEAAATDAERLAIIARQLGLAPPAEGE